MRRVFGRYVGTAAFVLGAIEALLITAAFCVGIAYMSGHQTVGVTAYDLRFSLAIVLTILIVMYLTGLYGTEALFDLRRTLPRIAFVTAAVFMLAVFATGQLTQFNLIAIYPDRWLWTISLTAVWLLCVLAPRMLFTQLVENGVVARRIVVVGDEPGHSRIAALSRELPRRFTVAAELSNSNFDFDLAALAARVGAAEIVVAGDAITDCTRDALRKSKRSGASVIKYANFYERETGRVDLTNSTEDWSRICTLQKKGLLVGIFQRAFDICISLLAFAVAAPVMLLAAIAIKLEDGGPVLFRQERVGLGGRNFTLVKFRSMHVNAEGDGAPTWAEHNDPRITRAGYFIRKLRIDELPQFWNVIKGDMSFIGPRPERPYFVRQLAEVIPYYDFRHCVRPGLTGWAQVSFRYSASFEDARIKTAYDLYYVKHRGILLDLIILMRTVVVVLWPEGVR